MKNELFISEAAAEDIEVARDWYESQKPGLGGSFLESLVDTFTLIEENPKSYAIRFDHARAAVTRKFPYLILYEIIDTQVVVFQVVHSSRDPRNWRKGR